MHYVPPDGTHISHRKHNLRLTLIYMHKCDPLSTHAFRVEQATMTERKSENEKEGKKNENKNRQRTKQKEKNKIKRYTYS